MFQDDNHQAAVYYDVVKLVKVLLDCNIRCFPCFYVLRFAFTVQAALLSPIRSFSSTYLINDQKKTLGLLHRKDQSIRYAYPDVEWSESGEGAVDDSSGSLSKSRGDSDSEHTAFAPSKAIGSVARVREHESPSKLSRLRRPKNLRTSLRVYR